MWPCTPILNIDHQDLPALQPLPTSNPNFPHNHCLASTTCPRVQVVKAEPKEITDGDVMSALIDKELVTKDSIVQALAISQLGEQAYIRHMLFQPPPRYD